MAPSGRLGGIQVARVRVRRHLRRRFDVDTIEIPKSRFRGTYGRSEVIVEGGADRKGKSVYVGAGGRQGRRFATVRGKDFPVGEDEPTQLWGDVLREMAVSNINRLLGWKVVPDVALRQMTPPTKELGDFDRVPAKPKTQVYVVMEGIKAARGGGIISNENDIIKIAIIDTITGQTDRHAANWLVDKAGHVYAIDNEGSFGAWKDEGFPPEQQIPTRDDVVRLAYNMKVPPRLLRDLKGLTREDFLTATAGINRADVDSAWQRKVRLQETIQKLGHIPDNPDSNPDAYYWWQYIVGKINEPPKAHRWGPG